MTAEHSCLRTRQELDGLLKDYNALVREDGTIPPKATIMFNQAFEKGSEDDPKCKRCGKFIAEHPNAATSSLTISPKCWKLSIVFKEGARCLELRKKVFLHAQECYAYTPQ